MSFIELKNINKKYKGNEKNSVTDFNLNIEEKEFIAFVGPSGCGKSTTLRMIAGFEDITSGDLVIGGQRMNETAPAERGISMVFQNYALYPHMTVEKNISYGLKNMKVPAEEIKKKVDWAVDILGLTEYRYCKPKNLSGGQRQRVALGRAIVKNQKLFLMDEPLSNLDAKLRVSMRNEISQLHRKLGSTTIYVTHDQVEAMTMADRIVIMKDGVIQQVGKPMELYEHPDNKFVAGFIGSPQMNFYDVRVDGNCIIFTDGSRQKLSDSVIDKLKGYDSVIMGIRGEDLKFDEQNLGLFADSLHKAAINNTEIMGNENNLYFEFGGITSVARVSKYEVSQIGDQVDFVFMPHKMHFFDKNTEKTIVSAQ
ncbi:sn-glycerol-3-phosphate ABC transporter ATP-binding protein UgpC [bacterium 1XD42-94]|nr:sn-glycerol-3-phosphate ABC transporter ATP-binding protein UgpC [bacterium 1XD42-76]NBK04532.1 sn-glycerol-3-phosphate ABC transporter ATP-binding protein UgpC [bacterium 1XD42-94]